MTWLWMDTRLRDDPMMGKARSMAAMISSSLAPLGLATYAACWSAEYGTDGFLPLSSTDYWDQSPNQEIIDCLVRAGVWVPQENPIGFRIARWGDVWGEETADKERVKERKRIQARERQAKRRECQRAAVAAEGVAS